MPRKLLIVSDSVSGKSGLSRIARDVAQQIHFAIHDQFTLATAGWGGSGFAHFPWKDYPIREIKDWVLPELADIAHHFAGDEELIVFFISDASRLGWFAQPDWCPDPKLTEWLKSGKVKKWLYGPIDAEGPNGRLTIKLNYIYRGFDRVLNYSKFSASVTGYPDYLPHGIDTKAFQSRDKIEAKKIFQKVGFVGLEESSFLIGIVATNQLRKDWALGIQTAQILLDRGMDVRIWCHTDAIERNWDIGSLISDFGLSGRACITTQEMPDETMNMLYSACDVTLGIGSGEGFGYPIYESLASGTPVLHHNYAGGAEWLPRPMRVDPV